MRATDGKLGTLAVTQHAVVVDGSVAKRLV
jgi:hypothetical protein